jgi:hypothetical protein
MRIRVKILLPITGPYGTYNIYPDGRKEWKYCRNIGGKWFFETEQKFNEDV